MALEAIRISARLPADPHRVYEAWLDSRQHAAFTQTHAAIEPDFGGSFRAGNGYIDGRILWLDPGRRIVMSWRTTEFPEDAEPSHLEILLEPDGSGGTRITLVHSSIPAGQGAMYEEGWRSFYLEPMATWLARAGSADEQPALL